MFIEEPSLKLFISLDAIGSTAYKNNNIHNKNSKYYAWMKFFTKFEKDTSSKILKSYIEQDTNSLNVPFFWKSLGDELIYVVDIDKYTDIYKHISLFIKIIKDANRSYDLKIKGSAFLAGFPVSNYIATKNEYPKHDNSNIIKPITDIDFLGPSIDLGFRISKYSNLNKFVVTADIAMVISFFNSESPLEFYYSGLQDTKGVLNNKYPIFWIEMYDKYELDYKINNTHVKKIEVCKYCEEFLFNSEYTFLPPILLNDSDIETDSEEKLNLKKKLETSIEKFKNGYKSDIEQIKEYITSSLNSKENTKEVSTQQDITDKIHSVENKIT